MPQTKQATHPFLSTTYQLHRLSPLFKFPTLDPAEHPPVDPEASNISRNRVQSPFKTHERALTNILKGEVLRGVNIASTGDGNANSSGGGAELGKLGRFKGCRWRLVPTIAALREYNAEEALRQDEDDEEEEEEERNIERGWVKAVREKKDVAGVEISFEYERGVGGYVAYLVGLSHTDDSQFTNLPLALTRLPKPLTEVLLEYLGTTFDTLVIPMGVVEGRRGNSENEDDGSSNWLGGILEKYVEHMEGKVDKDIALSYKIPKGQGGGIRIITIGLEKGDIANFLSYGKGLESRGLHTLRKRKREDTVEKQDGKEKGPFILAVEKYIESSMGIDATKLVLVKVACGGFVIGGSLVPATAVDNGEGGKDTSNAESMESSSRVKIFIPKKVGIQDEEDEDGNGDAEGRSKEEIIVEDFVKELIQLAIRKRGGIVGVDESGNTSITDGIGIPKGKKPKATTGRIPRGRIEIF